MEEEIIETLSKTIESCSTSTSSSDDSFSSDELAPVPHKSHKKIKIKKYIEETVYKYSDVQLREHFRLSRVLVEIVSREYSAVRNKQYRGGCPEMSVEKIILMSLWYLANMESFREIYDRFNVSLSSAHLYISDFTNALVIRNSFWIKWPTKQEATMIASNFYKKQKIPNVIGCIDGSHIRIKKPVNGDFINRKGYPSILLQGVVNHKNIFLDIFVGAPGSLHDARLLRKSKLFVRADEGIFHDTFYLLGDSAYPLLKWLITPYKDNGLLTEEQRLFNYKHSSTRIVVEHTFGLLKGRFRRLSEFQNESLSFIVNSVVASCVLHNICTINNDVGEDFTAEIEEMEEQPNNEGLSGKYDRRQEIFDSIFK